jgi:hypothetical protein
VDETRSYLCAFLSFKRPYALTTLDRPCLVRCRASDIAHTMQHWHIYRKWVIIDYFVESELSPWSVCLLPIVGLSFTQNEKFFEENMRGRCGAMERSHDVGPIRLGFPLNRADLYLTCAISCNPIPAYHMGRAEKDPSEYW